MYYYDHGKKQEALKMAQRAAETYSEAGLTTMALLSERMGNLPEAEKYFKQASERYGSNTDICVFYLRNADKNAQFKAAGDKLLKQLLPSGLKTFDSSSLEAPPKRGARVTDTSAFTMAAGMELGDILVAVNGYEIATPMQYRIAESLGKNRISEFVFWQQSQKKYKTAKLTLPLYKLGADTAAYVGQ